MNTIINFIKEKWYLVAAAAALYFLVIKKK